MERSREGRYLLRLIFRVESRGRAREKEESTETGEKEEEKEGERLGGCAIVSFPITRPFHQDFPRDISLLSLHCGPTLNRDPVSVGHHKDGGVYLVQSVVTTVFARSQRKSSR